MLRGWGQSLFRDAQWQDKGQWTQSGTQDVPPEHNEYFLYLEGDEAPEQDVQTGFGVSFLETFKTPGRGPVQMILRSVPAPTILWFSGNSMNAILPY